MDLIKEGLLVGIGNPLLDISANVDEGLLKKYDLKPDNAILAEESHMPLYKELVDKYKAEFIAGGSVQNTLRVAQWFLEKPNVATYFGCVGDDEYAKILKERASADGVNVRYQYTKKAPTGTCAVLITGTHRSLCANVAAGNSFDVEFLKEHDNMEIIDRALYFYTSGFFLAASAASVDFIAKRAHRGNHLMAMNLSAPFVSQFYKEPLSKVMPYIDILFGNETEMEAFAKEFNLAAKSMKDIALEVCRMPKDNDKVPRVTIITQGRDPVLLAKDGKIQEIPVMVLSKEQIVDTNGAGDAFTGGFLAKLVQGYSLDVCVKCGIYAASEIIQRSGCTYSGKPNFHS